MYVLGYKLAHLDLQAIDRFSEIMASFVSPNYPALTHQEVSAAIAVAVTFKGLDTLESKSPDVFNQRIRILNNLFSRMSPATSTLLFQSTDINTMEEIDHYFATLLVAIGLVHNLTDEETAWFLYSTRFSNSNILNKCKLESNSELHSQRVVATRDIDLNEVITIYPADYRFLSDIPVNKKCLVAMEKICLVGDSSKVDNPTFLGHMCRITQCNSEQCNSEQCNSEQSNSEQSNSEQCNSEQCNSEQCNSEQCNAVLRSFRDYFCCVIASAHIPAGQEIILTSQ